MDSPRRALISVTDKRGIVPFARQLVRLGFELISTGGTEKLLREADVEVRPASDITQMAEILGGRVKTLHPQILGGVLARAELQADRDDLEQHGIRPIQLVVVNLYAFEATIADPRVQLEQAIEQIDVGGPTLIRSAAKNHRHVTIVTDPDDYERVLTSYTVSEAGPDALFRLQLAQKAFSTTASYDAVIANYLAAQGASESLPDRINLTLTRVQGLRYGENPHQSAAFYRDNAWKEACSLADASQLQGKELSYNNLLDADAALRIVIELGAPGAVVVKHGNPVGAASGGETLVENLERALDGDRLSAFGGIVAVNQPLDEDCARALEGIFLEVILAPSFTPAALERLTRKKQLRLLEMNSLEPPSARASEIRRIMGGVLIQSWDVVPPNPWIVATKRAPTQTEELALELAWRVCKHVKSNAIVLAQPGQVVGVGAGQMSRVDSVFLAARKAGERSRGAVMASDAFFPFADGVEAASAAGVTAIVQPGGSVRDPEVVAAADAAGLAMVFTGIRHFRH